MRSARAIACPCTNVSAMSVSRRPKPVVGATLPSATRGVVGSSVARVLAECISPRSAFDYYARELRDLFTISYLQYMPTWYALL